ncbi:MAG: glucuronate isomerase [Bacteroidales bacterium]
MSFLDHNFMLQSDAARRLYHDYAAQMPIIDYHNHLNPKLIAEDHKFSSISEAWLKGDHYKWRAMRANGINEKLITGNTDEYKKFLAWAETVPYTMRNPLYHWTHMELQRYFGISTLLNPKSAGDIYTRCKSMLEEDSFSCTNLLKKMNVEILCTTDDPSDSLEYHKKIAETNIGIKVLPTFRPDNAMKVEDPSAFCSYLEQLGQVCDLNINNFDSLLEALQQRHTFFHEHGCRISDHGLSEFVYADYSFAEINLIMKKAANGKTINKEEEIKFKTAILHELAKMDYATGWTQQYHYGALRNNNSDMYRHIGADTGYDAVNDSNTAVALSKFLDSLASTNQLAKTIIYNLNGNDNDMLAAMLGCFQDETIPGKMQLGSGWWFLDQKKGMCDQINTLSVYGLLSRFVGMLTDSRSFLSFPRHEYFRRILCNLVGEDIKNGELPEDYDHIGKMIQDISYNNAKNYFGF